MEITDKKQIDNFMNKFFNNIKADVKKIELIEKDNKVDCIINSKYCCSIDKKEVVEYIKKDTNK